MKYTLDAGCWNSVMAVPACVVDEYIKLCSGDALKLILFLLRHGAESYTPEVLCDKLGIRSPGELEDAAQFWVQRGLIKIDRSRTTDERSVFVPEKKKDSPAAAQVTLAELTESPAEPTKPASLKKIGEDMGLYYSSRDVAERITADSGVAYLFKEAEKLYGHALKSGEMQTVLALVDTYGLPPEVALILLTFCFKNEKTTRAYISRLAQDWMDNNITTLEQANEQVLLFEKQNSVEEALRRELELKSKFTKAQNDYIKRWTQDWGFNLDMIMLAYEITVNAKNNFAFPYANKILENWRNEGVSTPEQVKQRSQARKESEAKASGDKSSFDVDDVLAQIRSKYKDTNT